ncbi:MAG: hypothetical protein WCO00_15040, partial [Rhodospirillaceae bacterium]
MTTSDKSQDQRFSGTPREDANPPADIDALAEQEEMARLMKTLRDSIPYQEEDLPGADPVNRERPAYDRVPLALDSQPALTAGDDPGDGDGDGEDDFARLLRTLREGIPDDPEPLESLDDLPPFEPHRYEPPESESGRYESYAEPYSPPPAAARPAGDYRFEPDGDGGGDDAELDEAGSEPDHPVFLLDDRDGPLPLTLAGGDDEAMAGDPPAATSRRDYAPSLGGDRHAIDVSPGEQAVIADLLRSIHEEDTRHESGLSGDDALHAPGGAGTGTGDGSQRPGAAPDDYDDEERADRGQVWKIVLALGSAAALGLMIALVNPFGDKTQSQPPNRVVVPLPPPPAPRPPTQLAEIKPVVVPQTPPPAPPPPPAAEPPPPPAPKPVAAPPPPPE